MYFQLSFRKACGYGHFFTFDTKGEKVLIPRLLFLYFMINIHILFPLLYTRLVKKHTIFPHAQESAWDFFHFLHIISVAMRTWREDPKKPKRNVLVTIHVDPNTNISKLKILWDKKDNQDLLRYKLKIIELKRIFF